MDYDVIIIGAGHNGLIASFYLAQAGLRVLVLEARPFVGGSCVTEELIPGFRFSTCANLVWALRPKIVRDLDLHKRGLVVDTRQFLRLQPDGRYLYSGRNPGSVAAGGQDEVQKEIAKFSAADAVAYPRWQAFLARLTRLLGPHLMAPAPRWEDIYAGCADAEDRQAIDQIRTRSIADLANATFGSEIMRTIGAGADMSGNEIGSGLLLGLVSAMGAYSETGEPVLNGFVRGGMGRLSDLIRQAAEEKGVEVRTGAPVARVVVSNGRATGVELVSGERIGARCVVSNLDPKRTFQRLVAPSDLDPAFLARVTGLQTRAAAGLKLHCALSEMPEYRIAPGLTEAQLRGATLILSPSPAHRDAAWDAAAKGELPQDPVIAAFITSVYDPTLAPAGKYTWSAYVTWAPVRPRRGPWSALKGEMKEILFKVMDRYSPNFRRAVIDSVLFTPEDLEERVYLTDGNIHHVDAIPSQVLWQRPLPELAGFRAPIAGLYLCGAGMHPWGEVCGAPGYNAAQVILADRSR